MLVILWLLELNGKQKKLRFADLVGIEVFKNYFKDANYATECGDFQFQFYIFDFKAKDTKYILDDEEDKIVKDTFRKVSETDSLSKGLPNIPEDG